MNRGYQYPRVFGYPGTRDAVALTLRKLQTLVMMDSPFCVLCVWFTRVCDLEGFPRDVAG